MKAKLFTLFALLFAFAAAQFSFAQNLGKANNENPVSPKPSFKIEYPGKITLKDKDGKEVVNSVVVCYDLHDLTSLTLKDNDEEKIMLAGVMVDYEENLLEVPGSVIEGTPSEPVVTDFQEGDVPGVVTTPTDNSQEVEWNIDGVDPLKSSRTITYTTTKVETSVDVENQKTTRITTVSTQDVEQTHRPITTLTYITHDLYCLEPNETYVLKMPLFNDQAVADEFDYKVMDCAVVKPDGENSVIEFSGNLTFNKPLLVRDGAELHITNEADIKLNSNLIVLGPTSGIRIDNGASLTVQDTAYFIGPKGWKSLDFPWLINHGTFDNGDRTIFTRSMEYCGTIAKKSLFCPIAIPVLEVSFGKLFSFYANKTFARVMSFSWSRDTKYVHKAPTDILSVGSGYMGVGLMPYVYEPLENFAAARFLGEICDNEKFDIDASSLYFNNGTAMDIYATFTTIDNNYQAPIDIRKVVEEGRATNIKNMQVAKTRVNSFYVYNTFSGITTYDGPMQYGYLLPHLTNAALPSDIDTQMEVTKEDLTTNRDVELKYATPSEYPYVRFYIENTDENSIHYGNRDVCAVYFLSNEVIATMEKNPSNGVDYMYEALKKSLLTKSSTTDHDDLYEYPYISSNLPEDDIFKPKYETTGLAIKALQLPENDGDYSDMFLLLRTKNSGEQFKFGVLDGNLQGLDMCVLASEGGELVSTKIDNPMEFSREMYMPNTRTNLMYNINSCYYDKFYLRFIKTHEGKVTSIANNNTVEPKIFAVGNSVVVENAEIGATIVVSNLSGAVVAQKIVETEREDLLVSEKGIYFVSILASNAEYNKKIAIK